MMGKISYKAEEGLECVCTVGGSIEAGVVMKRSYDGHSQYMAGGKERRTRVPGMLRVIKLVGWLIGWLVRGLLGDVSRVKLGELASSRALCTPQCL